MRCVSQHPFEMHLRSCSRQCALLKGHAQCVKTATSRGTSEGRHNIYKMVPGPTCNCPLSCHRHARMAVHQLTGNHPQPTHHRTTRKEQVNPFVCRCICIVCCGAPSSACCCHRTTADVWPITAALASARSQHKAAAHPSTVKRHSAYCACAVPIASRGYQNTCQQNNTTQANAT